MSRNLLSEISGIKAYSKQGVFATGQTITIEVYKNGILKTLTSNACAEIGSTGIYTWGYSDLDTSPTALSEFFWIMTNSVGPVKYSPEKPDTFGGYPELLNSLPQALDAADECRVTVNLYKIGGGIDPIRPEVLFDSTGGKINEIELLAKYHDGNRYFALEKIKPSYSQDVAEAFWILPRNSTVNVTLASFGIEKTTVTIPDQTTISLFDLLALP